MARVRSVFGHTATHGFGGIPWYRITEILSRILGTAPVSAEEKKKSREEKKKENDGWSLGQPL